MADILIRGMEMPTQCGNCPISTNTRRCTILWREFGDPSKRLEDCPLVSLPEGHGDLIDRDNMLEDIDYIGTNKFGMLDEDIRAFLRRYKPIVPAEGGTDT